MADVDTADYPSLGRLALLNLQLGVQARRVHALVAAELDEVERLFRAVAACDWDAVLQLSETLAGEANQHADAAVVRSAKKVCDALRRHPASGMARRAVRELLNACRAAKLGGSQA
ncbi:MAG: hypothetical protein DCC67_08880 [Planctomycetota bacterium]|nr:MAG: hypothetical protein DCC67_08880 [Planctomycetota bacterium]